MVLPVEAGVASSWQQIVTAGTTVGLADRRDQILEKSDVFSEICFSQLTFGLIQLPQNVTLRKIRGYWRVETIFGRKRGGRCAMTDSVSQPTYLVDLREK
jgi:hypothetical protein